MEVKLKKELSSNGIYDLIGCEVTASVSLTAID